VTVVLNGSELFRRLEFQNRTGNGWEEFNGSNELRLYDEGTRVRFRNIWLEQL
jgi:hypothetical protein